MAEVLITIGIIGVVAVLTIPALVAHNQEKGWNTAATVFERKLQESLKVMNTQSTLSGYNSTKDFVNELSRHMKIVNICDNPTDCFEDSINWEIVNIQTGNESEPLDIKSIKTAADLGQKTWTTEALGVQFANGTSAVMAYNDKTCKQDPFSNEITGTGCISMIYDTSGYANPNTTGKDVRGINSKINTCVFKSNSVCYGTVFEPEIMSRQECAETGVALEYCNVVGSLKQTEHSWASAYITCANQGLRLPTEAELFQLGSYIYNANVSPHSTTGLTFDYDRAALLGFKNANILLHDSAINYFGSYAVYFSSDTIKQIAPGSAYSCGENHGNANNFECQVKNAKALCVGN